MKTTRVVPVLLALSLTGCITKAQMFLDILVDGSVVETKTVTGVIQNTQSNPLNQAALTQILTQNSHVVSHHVDNVADVCADEDLEPGTEVTYSPYVEYDHLDLSQQPAVRTTHTKPGVPQTAACPMPLGTHCDGISGGYGIFSDGFGIGGHALAEASEVLWCQFLTDNGVQNPVIEYTCYENYQDGRVRTVTGTHSCQ